MTGDDFLIFAFVYIISVAAAIAWTNLKGSSSLFCFIVMAVCYAVVLAKMATFIH